MLTCLSRSVSVRSHGRLASLKHPVLSPPPLWNTPNKTPPKSTTNSYSLKLLPSFLPSFHSSVSFLREIRSNIIRPSLSQYLYRPVSSEALSPLFLFPPIFLSLARSLSLSPLFLSFTTRSRSLYSLNCFPYTMLLIIELILFHHIHQLFHNCICDPYNI